jgi:hypothetical protein
MDDCKRRQNLFFSINDNQLSIIDAYALLSARGAVLNLLV